MQQPIRNEYDSLSWNSADASRPVTVMEVICTTVYVMVLRYLNTSAITCPDDTCVVVGGQPPVRRVRQG